MLVAKVVEAQVVALRVGHRAPAPRLLLRCSLKEGTQQLHQGRVLLLLLLLMLLMLLLLDWLVVVIRKTSFMRGAA